jgi:hypothetical protein
MGISKIIMDTLYGYLHPVGNDIRRNDREFFDAINKRNCIQIVTVSDSTKTMKILQAADVTYLCMIIVNSDNIWANHPDFLAFSARGVFYGNLEINNGDYSVLTIKKCSATT